jgi:hypothetical protein
MRAAVLDDGRRGLSFQPYFSTKKSIFFLVTVFPSEANGTEKSIPSAWAWQCILSSPFGLRRTAVVVPCVLA